MKLWEDLRQQSLGERLAGPWLAISLGLLAQPLMQRGGTQPERSKLCGSGERREMCCTCSVPGSAVGKTSAEKDLQMGSCVPVR